MPTSLRRSPVTQTPEIVWALDVAARHWPETAAKPSTQIARLAKYGAQQLAASNAEAEPPLLFAERTGRSIDLQALEAALALE